MLQKDTFPYVVALRRELHQYPELGFDLPRTLALVRRELEKLDIPYTEEFGRSSIVATINPKCEGFTIGIRGDMDALPIQEETGLPFASKIPGQMHACGHDMHTAMLLGVARELKAMEGDLACRVKLLFTPAEEYINPGCKEMVEDGVMDDIDCAIACHVAPSQEVGQIRTRSGGKNGNSMGFTIEFFGKSAHAADQQGGIDAISMAVEAYSAMQTMVAREFKAREPRILNIGAFNGGHTNNVVCDYCKLFCSSRSHSDAVSQKLLERCTKICQCIAEMHGGEAKLTVNKFLPYVHNDPIVTEKLEKAAAKVVGAENISEQVRGMGGEDFAFISRVKPSVQFMLGVKTPGTEKAYPVHNVRFNPDESGMAVGIEVFLQFVLDNQNGIDLKEVKL